MFRVLIHTAAALALAALSAAQSSQQQPPATGTQGGVQTAQPPASGNAPSSAQHKQLQAKSQEELDAFRAASTKTAPEEIAAAATEFDKKYPDSQLRWALYHNAMEKYGSANKADEAIDMGRKALQIDADLPATAAIMSLYITESTRDTDLDRDEKLAEAEKFANQAIAKADISMVPATATPDEVKTAKNTVLSTAYSSLGNIAAKRKNPVIAEQNLRKAVDLNPSPAAIDVLRLSNALDEQKKYAEALTYARRAQQIAEQQQPGGQVAQWSKQMVDRLTKLTGGSSPPAGATPGATPGTPGGASAPPQTPAPQQQPNAPPK